jgi:hypothetical protein
VWTHIGYAECQQPAGTQAAGTIVPAARNIVIGKWSTVVLMGEGGGKVFVEVCEWV